MDLIKKRTKKHRNCSHSRETKLNVLERYYTGRMNFGTNFCKLSLLMADHPNFILYGKLVRSFIEKNR